MAHSRPQQKGWHAATHVRRTAVTAGAAVLALAAATLAGAGSATAHGTDRRLDPAHPLHDAGRRLERA